MDAINEDTMKQYFDLLEDTLKEDNLLINPAQIYNVDESGMPLDPKAPNIVAQKGYKEGTLPIVWTKGASHNCRICKCCGPSHTTHGNLRCQKNSITLGLRMKFLAQSTV